MPKHLTARVQKLVNQVPMVGRRGARTKKTVKIIKPPHFRLVTRRQVARSAADSQKSLRRVADKEEINDKMRREQFRD